MYDIHSNKYILKELLYSNGVIIFQVKKKAEDINLAAVLVNYANV
jgi:hypothetical protein